MAKSDQCQRARPRPTRLFEVHPQRAIAVIPSTASRHSPIPYNKAVYRQRNVIERMFARLMDFRRVATRYDKLAQNFLAGALIVATVVWWLN